MIGAVCEAESWHVVTGRICGFRAVSHSRDGRICDRRAHSGHQSDRVCRRAHRQDRIHPSLRGGESMSPWRRLWLDFRLSKRVISSGGREKKKGLACLSCVFVCPFPSYVTASHVPLCGQLVADCESESVASSNFHSSVLEHLEYFIDSVRGYTSICCGVLFG